MNAVSRFLQPADVERLNQLQLSARRVVEGTTSGRHRAAVKGASVEFRQHRAYAGGDEPRRLDWRVLARTDRPYVKEYDEETNLRCAIVLDRSASMAYRGEGLAESKFEFASRLVASLGYLMLAQSESVGLGLAGERLESWIAPHAGTAAQLSRVVDLLERATPAGIAAPRRALRDLAERLGRRSLVILVSDFFAPVEQVRDGLAALRHDRHELILFQVTDRDERTFPFRAVTRFRGLEREAPQVCEPALVRRQYLDNFARHRRDLIDTCRLVGAELAEFSTDAPVVDQLVKFLRWRG